MKCKHKLTACGQERGFRGSVSRDENPCAHGGITYTETCLRCGAEREVNQNQHHFEMSPWLAEGRATPGRPGWARTTRDDPGFHAFDWVPGASLDEALLVCISCDRPHKPDQYWWSKHCWVKRPVRLVTVRQGPCGKTATHSGKETGFRTCDEHKRPGDVPLEVDHA